MLIPRRSGLLSEIDRRKLFPFVCVETCGLPEAGFIHLSFTKITIRKESARVKAAIKVNAYARRISLKKYPVTWCGGIKCRGIVPVV